MRPRSLATTAAQAESRLDAINWERLAAEFALAYDATLSIPDALKRVFSAARFAPSGVSSPATDAVLAEVAREHGIAVDELLFGGKASELVAARDDAFSRLSNDGKWMSLKSIGRLFRMHHTSIMSGVARHRARAGAARPRLAVVGRAA